MKFTVVMKCPDALFYAAKEVAEGEAPEGLSNKERNEFIHDKVEEIEAFASEWIEYGEYCRIEFDTEAGTATVLKN